MHKFEENVKCEIGIQPQTAKAAATAGAGVSLAKYNNFALICQASISTAGTSEIFYIAQSTDDTTYSTSYLATCTLATSTTASQSDVIEVRAEQLSDGYIYVRGEYTAAATNTYQFVAAENVRFNSRFAAV